MAKKTITKEKVEKLLTASQAFNTIGGNKRLATYVLKKYSGKKSLTEWAKIFLADNVK